MSDDFDVEELPEILEVGLEHISVEGDPNEVLGEIQGRIEELESALDELDEAHPQTGTVRFELAVLKKARSALQEQLENLEQNGDEVSL